MQGRWQRHSIFTKFFIALGSFFFSYTHVICYILACVTHGVRGGLITLPLPLMVFFWATLSNPRPPRGEEFKSSNPYLSVRSSVFWVTMITYTEVIILVKFVFQFEFIRLDVFAHDPESPANLANILGVQHSKGYDVLEVLLLISLFLHRYILRKFGLWKDANVDKTFEEPINSDSRRTTAESINPGGPEVNTTADAQSIMVD